MTKHQIITFDSVEALCAAAQAPSSWTAERESVTGTLGFTGTASLDGALAFARDGWGEGLAKMRLALDRVAASSPAIATAPAFSLDVGGAFPLIAAAVAGDPMCMFNPAPISERARPVLRLVTSTALPAVYEAQEVFNFGAGLVAIIDTLEKEGFSVELSTCRCNNAGKERLTILTKVKGAGESLDLERLAFVLGSASYNRRLHFGVVEAQCNEKVWAFGYGQATAPQHGQDVDSDVTILAGPTMFKAGSKQLATPEAAFDAMTPVILGLLRDRYAAFPEVHLSRAA
jgi:hypothetical protein